MGCILDRDKSGSVPLLTAREHSGAAHDHVVDTALPVLVVVVAPNAAPVAPCDGAAPRLREAVLAARHAALPAAQAAVHTAYDPVGLGIAGIPVHAAWS